MILARVRRTLRERALIDPEMRVLAACSGGPDSGAMLVALANLREELGFDLEAASVDHGLRKDAAVDLEIARSHAQAAGVAFHALRVEVDVSGSIQAGARAARYAALSALAARIGAQRVAVGHTQDDQAETVLMRILRGASVTGLAGIDPNRADGVIRPLIDCSRADVASFAALHLTLVARDPTNEDTQFERVRVRGTLLPVLLREDTALVRHLAELADDARGLTRALASQADDLLERSRQGDESIDVSSWDPAPRSVRVLALRRWLEAAFGFQVGRAHLREIERALRAPAEVWLPNDWVLFSAGDGRLRVARRQR
jgi:tRNA(Ile)-lysidine synthase